MKIHDSFKHLVGQQLLQTAVPDGVFGPFSASNPRVIRLLVGICLIGSATSMFASSVPLTAKELGLMLRSGYSSQAVLHELSARKFADIFDSEIEKQLVEAGASPVLIDALRSGVYQLSPAEIAAAQQRMAALAELTARPASPDRATFQLHRLRRRKSGKSVAQCMIISKMTLSICTTAV
jgi:hypothetical protein